MAASTTRNGLLKNRLRKTARWPKSLVRATYAENDKDTTLKVTDKEIEDYVSKHKDAYKQEESRSIQYVAFSTTPAPPIRPKPAVGCWLFVLHLIR